MAIARLARQAKRPYGLLAKMTAVTILGICFIFVWVVFSSSSSSVTSQRESFEDIAEPVSSSRTPTEAHDKSKPQKHEDSKREGKVSTLKHQSEKKINGSSTATHSHPQPKKKRVHKEEEVKEKKEDPQPHLKEEKEGDEEEVGLEDGEERLDLDGEGDVDVDKDTDLGESVDRDSEILEDGSEEELKKPSKGKVKGPLFDPNSSYKWKLCSSRSKHNYIPCIDIEVGGGKVQSYRHTERSCPRTPVMCLVPLPHEGYESPLPWPESKLKVYEKGLNLDAVL